MQSKSQRPTGMFGFSIIWIGQILSLLGTAVSQFGMTLWIYDNGGKATPMAMIGLYFMLPMMLFSPVVGIIIDRSNRKFMMMISDLAAAVVTLIVFLLYLSGSLQIWHLYVSAFISGTFQGFQWPAYSAAISAMLHKKDYTRANAMLSMAGPASNIFAPMIAGALLGPLGIWVTAQFPTISANLNGDPGLLALLVLDMFSAVFAVGSLLFVHIPQPEASRESKESHGNFWHELGFGFDYILTRPSLLGLQLVFMAGNFFSSLGHAIYAPMILARSNNNAVIFGSVQTAGALGAVLGGIIISAWGGFKRRVHGVLLGWIFFGLGMVGMGVSRSLTPWLVIAAVGALFSPLINGSNQAIWQAKVPPDMQGRVFTVRRFIAWIGIIGSQALAGPLADDVFEPAMQAGGALQASWSWLVGSGPGAGMGLQFALAGLLSALAGLGGYYFASVRNAEDLIPDYDTLPSA